MTARSVTLLLLCLLATACGGSGGALSSSGGDRPVPAPPVAGGPVEPGGNVSAGGAAPSSARTGVVGRATTPSGEPVTSAVVIRTPVDPSRPITQEAAVTGQDGRFAWDLEPGVWDITVEARGLVPATERVTVVAGEQVEVDLVLTRR